MDAKYGRVKALNDVCLEVRQHEIVALLGANGAGKTTLLKVISGVHRAAAGEIYFKGMSIKTLSSYRRVGIGIAQSPEGRQVFRGLSVAENLRLGAYRRHSNAIQSDFERIYEIFPVLNEMRHRDAAELSGGQQQMLAIGRALMSKPDLLLLDEPSLGLAPLLIQEIFQVIRTLKSEGVTILVVEQNAAAALSIADRGYVLANGIVEREGGGRELLHDPGVRSAYLGL